MPKKAQPKGHIILGHDREKAIIEAAMLRGDSILLTGPTGSGKTTVLREVADKIGRPFMRISAFRGMSELELLGRPTLTVQDGVTVTGWNDGFIPRGMKAGAVVDVDDMNALESDALFPLFSLLDDDKFVTLAGKPEQELVYPSPGFVFCAAINPSAKYAGTKELNAALKSRFAVHLDFGYPHPRIEASILQLRYNIPATMSRLMVQVAVSLREEEADGKVFISPSTRDLLYWASYVDELGLAEAFEATILYRVDEADRAVTMASYENCFKEATYRLHSVEEQNMLTHVALGEQIKRLRQRRHELVEKSLLLDDREEKLRQFAAQVVAEKFIEFQRFAATELGVTADEQ